MGAVDRSVSGRHLNTIGLSMMLMALLCGATLHFAGPQTANPESRRSFLLAAAFLFAALIALLTPLLWTIWKPHGFLGD